METTREISSAIWRTSNALAAINEALLENGGEITPELNEALDFTEQDKAEVADNVRAIIAKDKAYINAIDEEIKRLQDKKKALTKTSDFIKARLLGFMQENGITRIETPLTKVTFSEGRESVDCWDEKLLERVENMVNRESLPAYIDVKLSINKTRLLESLKAGEAIYTEDVLGEPLPLAKIIRRPYILIK